MCPCFICPLGLFFLLKLNDILCLFLLCREHFFHCFFQWFCTKSLVLCLKLSALQLLSVLCTTRFISCSLINLHPPFKSRLLNLIFSILVRESTGDGIMVIGLQQLLLHGINLLLYLAFLGAGQEMKPRKLCVHLNFQAHMLR